MNLKKYISAVLLSGAAMGGLALSPGMADAAPLSGISVQPFSGMLTVTDDDSNAFGTSTTESDWSISMSAQTIGPGLPPAVWNFGGCSGPQDDGEVWVQVKVTATYLSSTSYQVKTQMDLYEDTSSACADRKRNFPLSQLDHDGADEMKVSVNAPGQVGPITFDVENVDEAPTLDHGELSVGFQSTLV